MMFHNHGKLYMFGYHMYINTVEKKPYVIMKKHATVYILKKSTCSQKNTGKELVDLPVLCCIFTARRFEGRIGEPKEI